MPKKNNGRCVVKKCTKKSHSRGLCGNHYEIARRAVNDGKTTWDRLVEEGMASPERKRGQEPSEFTKQIEAIGHGAEGK